MSLSRILNITRRNWSIKCIYLGLELLRKKIIAGNKIKTDEPDFSLNINYEASGTLEASRVDICVHRLSFDKGAYCHYGLEIQAGISPAVMIDIGSYQNDGDDSW